MEKSSKPTSEVNKTNVAGGSGARASMTSKFADVVGKASHTHKAGKHLRRKAKHLTTRGSDINQKYLDEVREAHVDRLPCPRRNEGLRQAHHALLAFGWDMREGLKPTGLLLQCVVEDFAHSQGKDKDLISEDPISGFLLSSSYLQQYIERFPKPGDKNGRLAVVEGYLASITPDTPDTPKQMDLPVMTEFCSHVDVVEQSVNGTTSDEDDREYQPLLRRASQWFEAAYRWIVERIWA